ncbi:hypothetical protein R1sor_002437 [Riccia sorocarpa]|uniref:Reverse transcriptase domain-containing protein n=1 Tax=Riccia sorocarpa TaxID=122646 RepID=A0ABD3H291_9MARC
MCEAAEAHFRRLLTEEKTEEEHTEDINFILERMEDKLSPEEKEAMEKPLNEGEIKAAVDIMKRGKSPGPDGATVEVFAEIWEVAGALINQVITRGANQVRFPAWFTQGDVVLLPKQGDPKLLGNKRPITLLKTVYKIYTKVLQRRLVPVLQRIVGWNQSAFLADRNIHTSILTCNEAIHTARRSGLDYLLLQLDFQKAFDSVNWNFLIRTLEKLNFGSRFCGYIKAILDTAASSIIVNGRRSNPVKVTRSVRQGCPLSPLLFILVTQALTDAVNTEVRRGTVQGIYLQLANMHYCLGLYADDSHAIFRAMEGGATCMRNLLNRYANATGLKIQWEKSTVSWIGPSKSNKPEWINDLTWRWTEAGEETKLLGFTFDEEIKAEAMVLKCERRIEEICNSPLYQGLSICGRTTVANATLLGAFWYILPLWAGSIETIDKLEKRVFNFVWSGSSRDTRHRIAKNIVIQNRRRRAQASLHVQTVFSFCSTNGTMGVPTRRASNEEDNTKGGRTAVLPRIRSRGCSMVVQRSKNRGVIWEWKRLRSEYKEPALLPENRESVCCYTMVDGVVKRHDDIFIPENNVLLQPIHIVKFRVGQGRILIFRAEEVTEETKEVAELTWKNGDKFFAATNGRLRQMLSRDEQALAGKLSKWSGITEAQQIITPRWRFIWKQQRARKECFLLWSITMNAVPTNGWRFPALPRSDPMRWCKRCDAREVEDTVHTFWTCQKAASTWSRVLNFFVAAQGEGGGWQPSCTHALLTEILPRNLKTCELWWETLRGATSWGIWLARNARNFSNEVWHAIKTDIVIWYRFTLYIKLEWNQLKGLDKHEERETFKKAWAFEIAGIAEDAKGFLQIPRQAPWTRSPSQRSEEEEPP